MVLSSVGRVYYTEKTFRLVHGVGWHLKSYSMALFYSFVHTLDSSVVKVFYSDASSIQDVVLMFLICPVRIQCLENSSLWLKLHTHRLLLRLTWLSPCNGLWQMKRICETIKKYSLKSPIKDLNSEAMFLPPKVKCRATLRNLRLIHPNYIKYLRNYNIPHTRRIFIWTHHSYFQELINEKITLRVF